MLHTKLILVEGLPGSGKSTIAQFIGMQIQGNNKKAEWYNEGDIGHPIDLGEMTDKGSFEPCEYMESRLEKWKSFADKGKGEDTVTVLESSMLQQPVNALLFNDVEDGIIINHIRTVFDVIEPLNPVLIYFHQDDVKEGVKKASRCKGENWTDRASQIIAGSLFGKSRNLQGFDGMAEYFLYRSKLENHLFGLASMNKLSIEISDGNWESFRKRILKHLQIDESPNIVKDKSSLLPYAGTFYNDVINCTFEFVIENGTLVDKRTGLAMVFKEEGVFYLPGLPTELLFQKNDLGAVDRMVIGGRENIYIFRNGTVFDKIHSEGI